MRFYLILPEISFQNIEGKKVGVTKHDDNDIIKIIFSRRS